MLFLLVILILFILLVNYLLNNRVVISPAIVFPASFAWGGLWALLNQNRWNLQLHLDTFSIILGSVITFSFLSFLVHIIFLKKEGTVAPIVTRQSVESIERWKLYILILLELITIYYSIHEIKIIAPAASLSASIYSYRSQVIDPVKSLTLVPLPRLLVVLRAFTDALGYFSAYLLAKGSSFKDGNNFLYLVILALCILSSVLMGSRGSAMTMVICAFIYWYILQRKGKQAQHQVKFVKIFFWGVVLAFAIFSFQSLATLLGRNVGQYSPGTYLSIYMGAEIKNLDTFLQNNIIPLSQGINQSQTFINLVHTLSKILGMNVSNYSLDLPFMSSNGYNLGNVYTCLYPYLYDFGYFGALILVGGIALISQLSFEFMRKSKESGRASLSILIYGRIAVTLIFAFFSNKFYEDIFTFTFIRMIVFWIVLNMFLIPRRSKKHIKERRV